ncbi:MAG: hypothetical protein JO060_05705 [Candidatus Eremiobacteraeota bacterium]|nr:hypothetical protein [Candidatus Eremiobacteraeota bacterium]MBV9646121.1 hypothetical protein [Candidatus Eremiobacteraeota bacterium]
MSGIDKAANAIKHGVDDVRDTVKEAGHRSNADAERDKRTLAGDAMTPGEKVGSALEEGKERTLAEVDRAKRDVRDRTT